MKCRQDVFFHPTYFVFHLNNRITKMTVPVPLNKQYGKQPFYYFNGLVLRNSVVKPLTRIRVSAGTAIDRTGAYQIGSSEDMTADIDGIMNGIGGIDEGTVSPNTVYGLYLIADPVGRMPTGIMFSLNYGDAINPPLMPVGYNCFSFIGTVATDSSSHIIAGTWTGNNGSYRTFTYDSPVLVLNGGVQTTYTDLSLTGAVPIIRSTPTNFYSKFDANAIGDIQNLTSNSSSGDAVTVIAPVAGSSASTTSENTVLSSFSISAGGPAIKYKVSAGALSLYVTGYSVFL